MIIRRLKAKDSLEAGVGVRGRAAAFARSRRREDGGAFMTEDGPVLEFRIGKSKESRSYVPSRGVGWDHPWKTMVEYYTKGSGILKNSKGEPLEGWGARIKPGFVSGIDPIVPGVPDIDIGEDKNSSKKVRGQGVNAPTRREALRAKPGLADMPIIPILSAIKGIQRTHQIPKQLRDLGAEGTQPDVKVGGSGANRTVTTQGQLEKSARYVGVVGFYVSVARPSHKLEVNFGGYPLTAIEYNVSFSNSSMSRDGVRPILRVGVPDPQQEPSFEDRLNGVYEDPGYDHFLISLVYFLSPIGENVEMKKDGDEQHPVVTSTWAPYVRHLCFWNLEYRMKLELPKNIPSDSVDPYLARIIGRYTIAPVVTANAAFSESNRILTAAWQRNLPKGLFWTI